MYNNIEEREYKDVEYKKGTALEEEVYQKRNILSVVYTLIILIIVTIILGLILMFRSEQEVPRMLNPGVRAHDDNDGLNRDIYMENFLSEETGESLLVRIRLEEYMEIGTEAGMLAPERNTTISSEEDAQIDEGHNPTEEEESNEPLTEVEQAMQEEMALYTVRGDYHKEGVVPDITDTSTWDIYLYDEHNRAGLGSTKTIRDYRYIEHGGSKIYMPTFDRNQSHYGVDVNGTVAGYDGLVTEGVAYDNYRNYVLDTAEESYREGRYYTISNDELYYYDKYVELPEGTTDYGQYIEVEEDKNNDMYKILDIEHIAQYTLSGSVISMADWLGLSESVQVGSYWVCDEDGWAYWAQPLEPQTATALLVDEITSIANPIGIQYYYAMNVVGQGAYLGDWGTSKGDYLGFYEDGITDNAVTLLEAISDRAIVERGEDEE